MEKKQTKEKQGKKKGFKSFLAGALIWVSKLLCIALLCVVLAFLVARIVPQNGYSPSIDEQLLSACVAIIGLAIAVWAGLNIVNSIERKDLEELRSRTDSIKQLVYNMDNIERLGYDAFLQALLRKGGDELTAYFYRQFSRYGMNAKEDYFILTRIEDLFGQVYDLHNTVKHHDAELIEKAEEAISYIKEYQTDDRLIRTYLTARNAEMGYYCGYVGKTDFQKYQSLTSALDLYQKILPELSISFPPRGKDGQAPDLPDGADRKLAIYMANTLGDTCSQILLLKEELTSKSTPKDQQVEEAVLEQYGEKAIFCCDCAVKWADKYTYDDISKKDYHYFELYYRNCAVAYERYDKFNGDTLPHAEIIIENYLKAFYHIVKGTKLKLQRVQSVYHSLLSYFKRYFDTELSFTGNNGPLDPFSAREHFESACKYNYKFDETLVKHLQEMAAISEIGMLDMPRNNIPAVMNGFAYSYVILLKLSGNSDICKQFTEDCTVYLAKIRNALSRLDTLHIQDKYTKNLQDREKFIAEHLKQTE